MVLLSDMLDVNDSWILSTRYSNYSVYNDSAEQQDCFIMYKKPNSITTDLNWRDDEDE